MHTFVVGTDDVDASAALCDYFDGRVETEDTLHAVNSLPGGDRTDPKDVRDGEDALNVIQSRLGALATVETHQFVRGNEPVEDLLSLADDVDADEVVVCGRSHSTTSELLFGSTARAVLRQSARPVVVVPLSARDGSS
jgi:nucleotide-binding universal stress UspA family protein